MEKNAETPCTIARAIKAGAIRSRGKTKLMQPVLMAALGIRNAWEVALS